MTRRVDVKAGRAGQLLRYVHRHTAAEQVLAERRRMLALQLALAAADGYSVRALAEATGLTAALVHKLITEGRELGSQSGR